LCTEQPQLLRIGAKRSAISMKPSYAALFGVFLAVSAYEGASRLDSAPQTAPSDVSTQAASVIANAANASASPTVESFPTISGGICEATGYSAGTTPCGDCKAICPAREFVHLIGDQFALDSAADSHAYLSAHWNVPRDQQSRIRFVIASLPDPVHTHMALMFDRGIETIQSAAQASGFLFARAWMPWDIASHPESTDFTVRLAQIKYRDALEALPGLMIFQKSNTTDSVKSEILFVLVVGETPTGGLRMEQFQNALAIRLGILTGAPADSPEVKTLRIFGPTFSGSLRTLYNALISPPDTKTLNIFVRSGSISSDGAIKDFGNASRPIWGDRLGFKTFQYTDTQEEYCLSAFFSEREHLHSRVAILSEDETAFGNQEPQANTPPPGIKFLRLYFPRGIAQLRDAYQRNAKAQGAPAQQLKTVPQDALPLSLSITGNDDDSVAPYSPLQTPLSEEAILQGIVSALSKEHARVVVIRAADPLDMIFLSRYLRQNYPQARLITVGADLLMVHEFYDPRFHGILALSPYPLLGGESFPMIGGNTDSSQAVERVFPDHYTAGSFNAMLSLLSSNSAEPSAPMLPEAAYVQYGLPSFLSGKDLENPIWPHLWLLTIGNNGYWPVARLDKDGVFRPDVAVTKAKYPARYVVHPSLGWTLFWLSIGGFTLAFAALLGLPTPFRRSEILSRFRISNSSIRNRLLLVGAMLLLAAQTIFVFPSIPWFTRGMWQFLVGYEFSVGLLGLACYFGFRKRQAHTLANIGGISCAVAVLVALCSTVFWLFWPHDPDSNFGSFLYRYIHVESGVSPSLPILLVLCAWIWWFWQSFTGVASTEEKDIVLPDPKSLDAQSLPDAYDRVRLAALTLGPDKWPPDSMKPIPCDIRVLVTSAIAILALWILMRPDEIAEAFEPRPYKAIYWFLLYSCLFLICFLTTQIIALWFELRSLLRGIYQLPFHRGFKELKGLTWKPLWKLAGAGREEFVQLLGEEIEAIDQIQKVEKSGSALADATKAAKSSISQVSNDYETMTVSLTHLSFNLFVCSQRVRTALAKAAKNGLIPPVKNWYATNVVPEGSTEVKNSFHTLQKDLANVASQALIQVTSEWKNEQHAAVGTKPEYQAKLLEDDKRSNDIPDSTTPAPGSKTCVLEHFLCLFYLNVILVPLRRLQTLILALAGVFVFVLMSYSSYPFESRESFHGLLISIFFGISLIVGIVYGQMYSNSLLSLITKTEPGELGFDFWVKIGTFVFIPLLSILSVQFPGLNDFLFSWLQPALQSVK